jgi:hypothetical protein
MLLRSKYSQRIASQTSQLTVKCEGCIGLNAYVRRFRACCLNVVNEGHAWQAIARTPRQACLSTSNRLRGTVKLMHANGCVISFQNVSSTAVVSAVERALVTCRGTVYVDLRSVPAPSLHTIDIIGKIYGRVAKLAPQRNVVPLLSTAYPQG